MSPKAHSLKSKKTATKARMRKVAGSPWAALVGVFALALTGFGSYQGYKNHQATVAMNELRTLVADFKGAQVERVGRTIFLSGEFNSLEEWTKARSIARALSEKSSGLTVSNLSRMSEAAKQATLNQMKREVRNRRVKIKIVGERFIMEGSMKNDFEADRAVEIAKAVLLLENKAVTRETAGAVDTGNYQETFAPVLLDMLRIPGE